MPAPLSFGWSDEQWREEKQKMKAMALQAGDTASEATEATLERILSTVQALKAKLAEHRAERDRQQLLVEQRTQEDKQKNDPRHYV